MAAHKLRDPVGKASIPQITGPDRIMVDDADRIMAQAFLLPEMTDVVQQGCDDHFLVGASITRQLCALQRVFELRDGLAKVGRLASRFEQLQDLIHATFGGVGIIGIFYPSLAPRHINILPTYVTIMLSRSIIKRVRSPLNSSPAVLLRLFPVLFAAYSPLCAPAQQILPDPVESKADQQVSNKDSEVAAPPDKRAYGILPNYRTVNGTDGVEPLTAQRKFWIASKDSFDYPIYFISAGFAGISQIENSNPSFGQGLKGYAMRYAAGYGDQMIGNMMTEGSSPSFCTKICGTSAAVPVESWGERTMH